MAHAVRSINRIIREALAAIDIEEEEEEQELEIRCHDVIIDGVNARHLANFLLQHPDAVEKLYFCFHGFTVQAVEIFRAFLAETSLRDILLNGNLGNENGGRLLCGLHGNSSIQQLSLNDIGLEGQAGGVALSELMHNMPVMNSLICGKLSLGVEGARALQAGICANQTVLILGLDECRLDNEGLSLIVDALLEGNDNTVKFLALAGNNITASGLPHLIRLLQSSESSSLVGIDLDDNPGLFDDADTSRLFAIALRNTKLDLLNLNLCHMPVHAIMALFQAVLSNTSLQDLCVYDHVQLQGQDLQRLLNFIPEMKLHSLHINLDFTAEHVLTSFHRNMSIQHLYTGEDGEEVTDGPVFSILERNRLLHGVVHRAVEAINVEEEEQELILKCHGLIIDEVNARYIADSLRLRPRAVKRLALCFERFTAEAVESFRAFLAETTLHELFLQGNLGNENARRLLSSLHDNASVTRLDLIDVGMEGATGGDILSALMQSNSSLELLACRFLSLGEEGARAMQPGIRGNETVIALCLIDCQLEDAGLLAVVDALEGNNTIEQLNLSNNRITSNALPHVTRLLQHASVKALRIDDSPGLFNDKANTGLFCGTLRNTKLRLLHLNFCQLPGHAVVALFQVFVNTNNTTLHALFVYDSVQLEGRDLEHLLSVIPQMQNLRSLCVNLDYEDEAVVSSFHLNSSLQFLSDPNWDAIAPGPVYVSLKRNRRLCMANELLDCEPRQVIPLGLWAKAIERLGDENTGASAVYKIIQEKLVMWCAPKASPVANAAAAADATTFNSGSNTKRERNHDSANDNGEPKQKRRRLLGCTIQ